MIPVFSLGSDHQGIVHVIGPELGVTQPGMTIVCGDSHTATHGAFGALAFGIGTSEVEHVLATQCLVQSKPRSMRILYSGSLGFGVTAKDLILATIGQMGVDGAVGHVVEYAGPAIETLSMEGRMTVCNMTIEGGGRAGMIAPDDTTYEWVIGRAAAPDSVPEALAGSPDRRGGDVRQAGRRRRLRDQPDGDVGHNAGHGFAGHRRGARPALRSGRARARVHGARARHADRRDQARPRVHRLVYELADRDLRAAADVVNGHKVADSVYAMVVPGSQKVKAQAEQEGLDEVFRRAGFDWRGAGCSMCLGMNPDIAAPGERVASTSNRNFEGRQGRGARSHLVSPQMAAAAAIEGRFVDIREWGDGK